MNNSFLKVSIIVTGVLLSILHYKMKPAPDEKAINATARSMKRSTAWQGQIAPDFELKTIGGESFRLSENIGKKIIVLNFFATWCAPCRAEMPELNWYFDEHKSDPFLILGIDSEETPDRVDDFVKDLKVDFPVGIDGGLIQKQYGVGAFPTTVVIGVDGKLQFYEAGAIANADVAFDNLLRQNRDLMQAGHVISSEDYKLQAQKQPQLPEAEEPGSAPAEEKTQLDERGKRIVARMDCPCGCADKVDKCTCHTSKNIQQALASGEFKDKSDDEAITELNKRFCVGAQ